MDKATEKREITDMTGANKTPAALNGRLDRIEEKLDRLSEAVISLARAEEKITALTSFSKQQNDLISKIDERVDKLESDVSSNILVINIINKFFWVGVAGTVTILTSIFVTQ